jgi:hypothetical protein
MRRGSIVMRLLFREDEPQRGNRGGIFALKRRHLLVKVVQDDPLDRSGSRRNRIATE